METVSFPIESTHLLMFARAVGYDDPPGGARSAAQPVPPTFTEAVRQFVPDDEFRPRRGVPWVGSASAPTGLPQGDKEPEGTLFHAEQHFTYHRPVEPGSTLTAAFRDGEEWVKRGRRGGELRFRERIAEFRDEAGELLVTSRLVSVETGRTVEAS